MSDVTGVDDAQLTVLLDLRNPQSYLALEPARRFGEERGLAINWLPAKAPPLRAPSEPGPGDDRSILHRRHRARHIAREIETVAAARGLVLRDLYRDADASAFELGWLWLRAHDPGRLPSYLEAGFRAWWAVELDPSSLDAARALLEGCGCDASGFDAWCDAEGRDLADALSDALRERGVSGVPAYLVDGEYFQGRQHLPMIGWILEGREGPGPI